MNADLIYTYKNILEALGIQFLLINKNLDNLDELDYKFRSSLYDNFDYETILKDVIKEEKTSPVLFFKDDFNLNYCFFELPSIIQEEYKAKYAILGPVIYRFITQRDLDEIMEEHHFPLSISKDLLEFYNRIPSLPTHDFWISLLMPLLKPLFGSNNDYHFIDIAQDIVNKKKEKVYDLAENPDHTSFQAVADRYKAEDAMLAAVINGNTDLAVELYHRFRQFNISPRTPDNLRNVKNFLIIFNTNLRRAADTAQIHPYYIDNLSREFAIRIESTNNISQLESLSITMLRRYCMLVHNYSTKNFSSIIKKCIEKIRFEYNEHITLDSLASYLAITPSYLSVQFKKETSQTITDYIQNVRLEHAILLLNSTSDSIQEIASLCGFPDSNYFTRVFKKKKGLTPKEYRKHIK